MENLQINCRNCGETMSASDRYCAACGQKHQSNPPTVRELLAEAFDAIFNLDSKIFRTLRAMVVPGRLTLSFWSGQRVAYIHPIRLFLVLGALYFSLLGLKGGGLIKLNFDNQGDRQSDLKIMENLKVQLLDKSFKKDLKSKSDQWLSEHPHPGFAATLDSILQSQDSLAQVMPDSVPLSIGIPITNRDGKVIQFAMIDLLTLSPNMITEKYRVEGRFQRLAVRQSAKIMQGIESFSSFMLSKMIWMVLLTVPFLTLLLMALFSESRRYYAEHLIVILHIFSFGFLSLGLVRLILPDAVYPAGGLLVFSGLLVYSFLALRRLYDNKPGQTFLKFLALSFGLLVSLIASFLVVTIATLLLF